MFDGFSRRIHYLRISVTDRCNHRCVYCMPAEGVALIPRRKVLSFEEIEEVTRAAVEAGIDKVRLTGGEPLSRRGIVTLVDMLARIEGIRDLAMTTNGAALEAFAQPLRQAGLHRLNISLDTLNPERYAELTRGGDIGPTLAGIQAAKSAGFQPIKLNCVIETSPHEPDAEAVAEFAENQGLEIRFIRRMDIAGGSFWVVRGGTGGDCPRCNRLRLSSDGMIYPCLFSDLSFNIRELGPAQAIRQAVRAKPKSGTRSRHNRFYAIGG